MDLIYRIPMALIRAYARRVTPLQAQESMRWAERIGIGTGSIAKREAKTIRRAWLADVNGGRRTVKRTLPPGQLGSMGIKFVKAQKTTQA